jgi:hypothetical protein
MPPKSNLSTIIRGIQGTPLVITDQGEAKVMLSGAASSGLATEATLLAIYNNMVASQDVEILLVRDTGNADKVVQQIREYDQGTGVWTTRYEDVDGAAYVPVGPLEYLDPSAVLNLVLAELIDQGLSLDTILTVLNQVQTNTLNTVNELTTANVTLNDIEGELISLNSTAGTLATEATLELVRLLLVSLDGKDFATETTLLGIKSQTDLLNFIATALEVNVTSSALPVGAATETTLGLVLTELQGINLDTNGLNQEITQLAIAADIATIETNIASLNTKLNTLGQKASVASAPVVLSTEQEAILAAIQTAVQNIDADLGTGGLALETTQVAIQNLITSTNALLTTIDADTSNLDVLLSTRASEVTLLATNALLTTIDAVLDNILLDTNAMVVDLAAIEVLITATNALLTTIDADTGAIATSTANIDTALTPTTRTHNYAVSNGVGSVPAGSMCGSVLNNGSSAGTWNGNALPAGVSVEWSAVGNRDTYGAITFDATGTEFIIEYTT